MLVGLRFFTLFAIFMVGKADDDVSFDVPQNVQPETPDLLATNKIVEKGAKTIPIEAESSLKFVVGFFRHGTRASFRGSYAGDPYSDVAKYFPEGRSQLTKSGKQQMYNLGKLLKQRYGAFLGDIHLRNTTNFLSTPTDRTIMSAEIMAYGLYPATGYQKWSENTDWNPIVIDRDNYDIDKTIVQFNNGYCPKYDKLLKEALDKLNTADNVQEAIKLLSAYTNDSFTTAIDVFLFFDYLQAQDLTGLVLPEGTKAFYPDKLRAVAADVIKAISAYNAEMINLTAGPLMNYLRDLLTGKSKKTLDPNYSAVFFSGHDTTIYPIMAALGFKRSMYINPASALLFEIHEVQGVEVVKIFYIDQTNTKTPISEKYFPNCGRPYCRINTVLRKFNNFLESSKWANYCSFP